MALCQFVDDINILEDMDFTELLKETNPRKEKNEI